MTPIPISVPQGARVTNHLFAGAGPEFLLSDLVTIALANERYIDVGWYPEGNPQGSFIVRAFFRDWSNQLIHPIECKTCWDAAKVASSVAFDLDKPIQIVRQPPPELVRATA